MAFAAYLDAVQKIYIAFYQRPADPAGLRYWAQRMDAAGGDQAAVIDAFATSPEAVALYGPIDASTIGTVVDAIYLALYNRAPDADGKKFYVDGFNAGTFTPGTIALNILNGASNDDAVAIANKLVVANQFTQQVDGRALTDPDFGIGSNFNVTYSGDADAVAARDILKAVTSSPSTVLNASQVTEVLKDKIADPTDPIQGDTGGKTFVLTANQDIFTGTAENDTFEAPLLGAAGATGTSYSLTLGDKLDGGAGIDTLNASVGGAMPSFSLSNIEKVFLTPVTAATVANAMTGVQELWMKAALGNLDVTGISRALTIGVENAADVTFTANYADVAANSAIDQVVVLNGAAGDTGVSIDLGTYTTAAFKSLTVNAQGVASENISLVGDVLTDATALTINATADLAFASGTMTMAAVTTATFTGDGAIDLGGIALGSTGGTAALTINATAASAGLTVELGNTGTAQLTANFGAGKDSLDIDARVNTTGTVAVNMGAGDDTVSIDQALLPTSVTNVSIVGGDGVDTLSVADVSNAADVTAMKFGNVSGFEVLNFATDVALTTAATLDLTGEGMNTVVFEAAASNTGALTIKGLASDAAVEFAGATIVQTGLSLDNAGSATIRFTQDAAVTGTVDGALTLSNATSLVFDINDTSTDGTGAVNATVSLADIIASKIVTLSFTGGEYDATVSTSIDTLTLDLSGATFGTATTDSNLDALTTIDLSGFNGAAVLDLDATTGVQKNKLTIKLSDGSAVAGAAADATAAATAEFVQLTLTDKADTIVFAGNLKAQATINDFTSGLGGDVLNLAALGVKSISDLDVVDNGSGAYTITSDLFAGTIEVNLVGGGSATTLTSDNFIFA